MNAGVWASLASAVVAHLLALLSPGPDFVLIVNSGMRHEKKHALGIAIGIAAANAVHIFLCLIGVGSLLSSSLAIMTALKIGGGLYLLYLGIVALAARKRGRSTLAINGTHDDEASKPSLVREFRTGLTASILNPKLPLFYLSLFTLVLTPDATLILRAILGLWMTAVVFLWDAFILFILSKERTRGAFQSFSRLLNVATGAALSLIGLKILVSTSLEWRHHAFTSRGGYEEQQPKNYLFDSQLWFTRGYDAVIHKRFIMASADYAFSIADPDLAPDPLLHVKRVKGNLPYDDGCGFGGTNRRLYRSAGAELSAAALAPPLALMALSTALGTGGVLPKLPQCFVRDRSQWRARKISLAEEGRSDDVEHLSPAERVAMVWQLTAQAWTFKDGHWDEPRLRRDVVRTIRGGR